MAIDGIAVVAHPDNPVGGVSLEQLRKIFSGAIANWKEVGGEDKPIVVIGRTAASGTREFFSSAVMQGDGVKARECFDGNADVQACVLGTPGAIGYVGLGFLNGLKVLAVEGVQAGPETVAAGAYPVSRPLFMVTNGYPGPGPPCSGWSPCSNGPAAARLSRSAASCLSRSIASRRPGRSLGSTGHGLPAERL